MQSEESVGKNVNGSNNINYHRNVVGHSSLAKHRPRVDHHLSMSNHRSSHSNSGFKNEDKERQKQEARAQREMSGRSAAPPPEPNEAVFTLVPQNGPATDIHARVSKILGDYYMLRSCGNSTNLIGVDEQPPTPAPALSSHIHDPDTYNPHTAQHEPPPSTKSSSGYSGGRPHHNTASASAPAPAINGLTRPKGSSNRSSSASASFHNPKPSEEGKRPHKSGPGPGNSMNDSSISGRPHSNNERSSSTSRISNPKVRAPKDHKEIKLHEIFNEVNSISDPSPNLDYLKTPRPDHHQSFTFPHVAPPNHQPEFRVPMDPHIKGRSSSSDRSKTAKTTVDILSNSCELGLSEESEDEASSIPNNRLQSSNPNETYVKPMSESSFQGATRRPISPLTKSTDDSSNTNSEDSSTSGEESSSSDDDPVKPQSPQHEDGEEEQKKWSIEKLFMVANPSDSPTRSTATAKSYPSDDLSPQHVNEVTPPIITKIPQMPKRRRPVEQRQPKTLSSDESSDEEQHVRTPKAQKTAGGRPIHSSYPKVKIDDPILSSDSEDELPPPTRKLSSVMKPSRSVSKSPRGPPTAPKHKKKSESKRKESVKKSCEMVPSDADSDSDRSTRSSKKMRPPSSRSALVSPKGAPVEARKDHKSASSKSKYPTEVLVELDRSQKLKQVSPVAPKDAPKKEKKQRKSRGDKENKAESVPEVLRESVNCRLEAPATAHHKNPLAGEVQYVNGVPKIVCSISLSLIDQLPKGVKSEDKVNKKVLKIRTSGDKKPSDKSPPNEDNTKLKAIKSIYKTIKRPSSLEPDKIKRDTKSDDSPIVKAEDNQQQRSDAKFESKVETTSNLKRHGSSSSLSSINAQEAPNHKSKRHKKDKRKEEQSYESVKSSKRKKRTESPEVEPTVKRRNKGSSRREESEESSQLKKDKLSPVGDCTPPRLAVDDRLQASMSSEQLSSRRSKKSSQIKQSLGVEAGAGTSGDTSEYHSLPSSEHESRNGPGGSSYRPGPSPIPPDMYPPSASQADYVAQPFDTSARQTLRCLPTWERKTPEARKEHVTFLNKAKELKHKADKESQNRTLQTIMYLEAVLYFILTGECMEADSASSSSTLKMFTDTLLLIKHVTSLFRRDTADGYNKFSVIVVVLSLRCQSLLSLKSYTMKRLEMKETNKCLSDYTKMYQKMSGQLATTPCSGSAMAVPVAGGGGTPGLPAGWSQRGANHSPSSLSPTPSPAGSVGSEGSQSSSGYSTEGTRQQRGGGQPGPSAMGLTTPPPTVGMPVDVHSSFFKYFNTSNSLYQAYEWWHEAEEFVKGYPDTKEFFLSIDIQMGQLLFHSSFRELVPYVMEALNRLKVMANTSPEGPVASPLAKSGVK